MPAKPRGRKTLTLCCPYCSHEQTEPLAVLSTYCRRCSNHYQVIDHKAVASGTPIIDGLDDHISTGEREESPAGTGAPEAGEESPPPQAAEPSFAFRPNGTTTVPCERSSELECLDCGHLHTLSSHATSSLCPRCGSYISLKDYDLREARSRPIRTRGDVHIRSNGSVIGASITCRHLTVEGEFNGAVDCSGDLTIRHSCEILGRIKCQRLIVQNQAKVTCASGIQATEVRIDGTVEADISCPGRLELLAESRLAGDINIAKLIISEGATHEGRVSMVPTSGN